LNYLQLSSI